MFSFNLIEKKWLPCVMRNGTLNDLSLREVLLDASKVTELVGDSPPVTIALHRLLLAILHRALSAPRDTAQWNEIRQAGNFDRAKLEKYFDEQKPRFDLFDETRPFYQSPSAKENVQNGAIIQLYFQGKNNATLFDHSTIARPKTVTPAEAARFLVAFQGFDFGGIKADGSAQTAPLLQNAIALVRDENLESLFETLLLNFHQYNAEDEEPFPFSYSKDLPAWERDAETRAVERLPDGYVDLLTWQARRISLQPERNENGETIVRNAVIMRGYALPKTVERHKKETMTPFRAPKDETEGIFPVGFSETRALWRNSRSLFQTIDGKQSRPKTLNWLNSLARDRYLSRAKTLPIEFYGLAADKGKLLFWQKESFNLPLAYLDDDKLFELLETAIQFAEEKDGIAGTLRSGIKKLAESLNTDAANFPAMSFYWATLELEFHKLLVNLPNERDAAMRTWFGSVYQTADDAFERTANILSGSAAEQKAIVEARNEFHKWRNVLLSKHKTDYAVYLPERKLKGGK